MAGIKQIKQGLVTIFTLQSAVVGDLTETLQEQVSAALEAGELQLVLDFRQVTGLNSTTLEVLLACSRLARRKGGSIKIVHLNEVCHDILAATRLEQLLEVYPNIPKALQSCL